MARGPSATSPRARATKCAKSDTFFSKPDPTLQEANEPTSPLCNAFAEQFPNITAQFPQTTAQLCHLEATISGLSSEFSELVNLDEIRSKYLSDIPNLDEITAQLQPQLTELRTQIKKLADNLVDPVQQLGLAEYNPALVHGSPDLATTLADLDAMANAVDRGVRRASEVVEPVATIVQDSVSCQIEKIRSGKKKVKTGPRQPYSFFVGISCFFFLFPVFAAQAFWAGHFPDNITRRVQAQFFIQTLASFGSDCFAEQSGTSGFHIADRTLATLNGIWVFFTTVEAATSQRDDVPSWVPAMMLVWLLKGLFFLSRSRRETTYRGWAFWHFLWHLTAGFGISCLIYFLRPMAAATS